MMKQFHFFMLNKLFQFAQFNITYVQGRDYSCRITKINSKPFKLHNKVLRMHKSVYYEIVQDSASYGSQLNHLKQEVNEAYQQIENALEVASEHQRIQLEQISKRSAKYGQ